MGLLHLRNSRFIDGVRIAAVADKSKRGLSEARSYGAKNLYTDYEDLLKLQGLDAVVISLPNYLHRDSAMMAAETGLHVFIEKPLARNVSECRDIARSVEKSGVQLGVGHNYRFFDHVRRLKAELDRGSLGDVEIANLEHFVNGPFAHPLDPSPIQDWWLDLGRTGGGCLLDQGVHLIDLFRWFFPDPEVLYAQLGHRYDLPVEDSAILILQSRRTRTRGIVSVGWFQKMFFPHFNFRLNLHGTSRFMSTDFFVPKNLYFHAAKEATRNALRRVVGGKIKPLSYTYYYRSYFEELRSFIDEIDKKETSSVLAGVQDGMAVIDLIEQCYELATKSTL